jgi:hypothetical protein
MLVLFVAASALAAGINAGQPIVAPGGHGGVAAYPVPAQRDNCVPSALADQIRRDLALWELGDPPAPGEKQLAAAPLLPTTSLGAIDSEDGVNGIFVDLDPTSPGFKDFSCHDFTYDGHAGHDIGLRSWAEMQIGVPVFAVRDGTVASAQDGFADMNLQGSADAGNYVIVDHGGGQFGWYFHLKKNSVAFSVGQSVRQGDQLGLAASSGNSFGPHLHFEIDQGNVPVEPMAGPCGNPTSLFAHQQPLVLDPRAIDFGVTTTDLFQFGQPLPTEQPKQGQIPLNAGFVYYWMQLMNLPVNAQVHVQFLRPDNSVSFDTTFGLGNTSFLRYWPGFFYFWVNDMQTTLGTWHCLIDINGTNVINAPIDVVTTVNPSANHLPEAVGLAFDPATPSPQMALFCSVVGSPIVDDRDWDVVRYHYVWKVNGATVRDVVSAGRRDAIARNTFAAGATVSCTVTPNDGKANGPTASKSAVAAADAWTSVGAGKYGTNGVPWLAGTGSLAPLSSDTLSLSQARTNATAFLFVSTVVGNAPLLGGTFVPTPILSTIILNTGPASGFTLPFSWPSGLPSGMIVTLQVWMKDPGAWLGASSSNGVKLTTP